MKFVDKSIFKILERCSFSHVTVKGAPLRSGGAFGISASQIFEKSIFKLLKRGCRTQYDLSISSLSLAIIQNISNYTLLDLAF